MLYTRPRGRGILRKRICRHCGAELLTWERPSGSKPASDG